MAAPWELDWNAQPQPPTPSAANASGNGPPWAQGWQPPQQPQQNLSARFFEIDGNILERTERGFEGTDANGGGIFIPESQFGDVQSYQPLPAEVPVSPLRGVFADQEIAAGPAPGLIERFNAGRQTGFDEGNIAVPLTRFLTQQALAGTDLSRIFAEDQFDAEGNYLGRYQPGRGEILSRLREDRREEIEARPYMPPPTGVLGGATDFAGQVAGAFSSASPENFIGVSVARMALTPLRRMAIAMLSEAGINMAIDPAVQGLNISTGGQEEFSAMQVLFSGLLGAGIGGAGRGAVEGFNGLRSAIAGSRGQRGLDLGEGQFGPDNFVSVEETLALLQDPNVRGAMQELGLLDMSNPAHQEILSTLNAAAPDAGGNLAPAARIVGEQGLPVDRVGEVANRLTDNEARRATQNLDEAGLAELERLRGIEQGIASGEVNPAFDPRVGRGDPAAVPEVIQMPNPETARARREMSPDRTDTTDRNSPIVARAMNERIDAMDAQAEGEFNLARAQADRITGAETRDVAPAGRPQGIQDTEFALVDPEGFAVRETGRTRELPRESETDPVIIESEVVRMTTDGPGGSLVDAPDAEPYWVQRTALRPTSRAPQPRGAQDFVRRAEQFATNSKGQRLVTPERERLATQQPPQGTNSRPLRRAEFGRRGDPVDIQGREPGRTFSASSRPDDAPFRGDGTNPDTGGGGPTRGRSPIPEQTDNFEGRGPFRPYANAEEAAQAARRAREDAARNGGRGADRAAEEAYRGARATNEPRRADDGNWDVDEFGYVRSTGDGPIVFTDAMTLGRALIRMQRESRGGQMFEPANYPGREGAWTIRERGRTGEASSADNVRNGDRQNTDTSGQEVPRRNADDTSQARPLRLTDENSEPPFGSSRRPDASAARAEASPDTSNARGGADAKSSGRNGRPESLTEFLRRAGGVYDDRGDLRSAFDKAGEFYRGGFIKRPGQRGGISLNNARERAEAEGFIQPGEDIMDVLLEAANGQQRYRPGEDARAADFEGERRQAQRDEELEGYRDDIERVADKHGARSSLNSDDINDLADELRQRPDYDDNDILDMIDERIDAKEQEALSRGRQNRSEDDLPLFDEDARAQGDLVDEMRGFGSAKFYSNPLFDPDIYARFASDIKAVGGIVNRSLRQFLQSSTALRSASEWVSASDNPFRRLARYAQFSAAEIIAAQKRIHNSAAVSELLDMLKVSAGRNDVAVGAAFEEAYNSVYNSGLTRWAKRLKEIISDRELRNLTDDDWAQISRRVRSESFDNSQFGRIARAVKDELKDWAKYLEEAGVDMGFVDRGYLPRIPNEIEIGHRPGKYKTLMARAYEAEGLSPSDARAAADSWFRRIMNIEPEGTSLGTPYAGSFSRPNLSKGRDFGPAAERILQEGGFYINNINELLGAYITNASRLGEFTRRFGNGGERWAELEQRMFDDGLSINDVEDIRRAVREITGIASGERADGSVGLLNRAFAFARSWNTVATLTRATLTSLQEVAMPAIRAGRPWEFTHAAAIVARDIFRRNNPSEMRDFAEDIGAVVDSLGVSMQTMRWSGLSVDSRFNTETLDTYFRLIGLEQLTRSTRVAAVEFGRIYIRRQLRNIERGRFIELSKANLRELGIPDARIAEMTEWLSSAPDGKATVDMVRANEQLGRIYRDAVARFTDQTIMRPQRADKPVWANRGFGSLLFQLTSFLWSFQRNFTHRNFRRMAQGLTNKNFSAAERAALMSGPALQFASLFLIGSAISNAREYTLNRERFNERSAWEAQYLNFSRVGFAGQLDPLMNSFMSTRYNRTVAQALSGVTVGKAGDLMDATIRLWSRNNENTPNAERAFARQMYDTVVEPAVVVGMITLAREAAKRNPVTSAATAGAAALGIQYFGLPDNLDFDTDGDPEVAAPRAMYMDLVGGVDTDDGSRGGRPSGRPSSRPSGRLSGRPSGRP